ncbi:LCP family protein [Nocardioides sp. DS6]|uniref:LCP family protein n=1 Tax=Nocardioides eburneus TaxID=3231482 RepID=A0ABV3SU85_9ACTN
MPPASDTPGQLAPRHKRTVLATITATLVVLALVTGLSVFFLYRHLDGNIRTGAEIDHQVSKKKVDAPKQPLNLLLLGTDTRDCTGCGVDQEAGGGLSDTTIILHVSADRQSAVGISIPRDTLVDPVACTRNAPRAAGTEQLQWNEAYKAGGADCTAAQVEHTFGVYIDGYLAINFGGFKDMVNAIGGVDVCIPKPLDDPKYLHVHFDAGSSVHLNGAQALSYVRLRHVGSGTDVDRTKRQQTFIAAMVKKVVSAGTLARPDRLYRFANALTKSIETNPELAKASDLVDLAEELKGTDLGHIRFITVPNHLFSPGEAGYPYVGLSPSYKGLMTRIREDRPLGPYAKGSLTAKGPKKHAGKAAKSQANAVGICA